MTHYWLITEPARGTSIKIDCGTLDPETAIETWGEQWAKDELREWRSDVEGGSFERFSTYYADASGDDVKLIDETNSWRPS